MPFRLPAEGPFEGDWSALIWWAASHRSSEVSPERRLCWAVLEDAIGCLRRPVRPVPQQVSYSTFGYREHGLARHEARRWVASSDRTWPFSFENLCDFLSLEPDWLRKRIAALSPQVGGSGRPKVRSAVSDHVVPGVARTRGEAAANRGTVWSVRSRGTGV